MQEQTHPNLYPLAGDDHPFDHLRPGCANWVGVELAASQDGQPPETPIQRQRGGRQLVVQAQILVAQDLLCGRFTERNAAPWKKAPAYRGKSGPYPGTVFFSLGLGVVLYLQHCRI